MSLLTLLSLAPSQMPVFFSPSSAERRARLLAMLDAALPQSYCRIELPPVTPDHVDVRWTPSAPSEPVVITHRGERIFELHPPFGALQRSVLKKEHATRSSIGAAHKVANAVFHLNAIRTFAERSHPCVRNASWAAIFEDDVEFVKGISPGSAATFPLLIAAAAAQAHEMDGTNKLQLSVGNEGAIAGVQQGVLIRDKGHGGRRRRAICTSDTRAIVGWEQSGARFLSCKNYCDSHSYLLHHDQAVRLKEVRHCTTISPSPYAPLTRAPPDAQVHAALMEGGEARCVNPWGSESCGQDPGVLRDFYGQCDQLGEGRGRFKRLRLESNQPGRCRGLALAGHAQPWALLHNNTAKHRIELGGSRNDLFPAVQSLVAFLLSNNSHEGA